MFRGLYSAASGLQVASEQQEVTAYNLANSSVPGYRQRAARVESFDQVLGRVAEPTGDLTGAYVNGVYHDFRPGAFRQTGNTFDLALSDGNQFFVVSGPNGPVYTRNGMFRATPDGRLVTIDGYAVQGQDGPVTVPQDAIKVTVGVDGSVTADGEPAGRVRVVRFADLKGLRAVGPTLYSPNPGTRPETVEDSRVLPGYVESSNVDPADAMVRMIIGARYYEAAQRSLRAISESVQLNTRPQA